MAHCYVLNVKKNLQGTKIKKNIHYYYCPRCSGVNINANTTKAAKGDGVNKLFEELLKGFKIPAQYLKLFSIQLNKFIEYQQRENVDSIGFQSRKLTEKRKLLMDMKKRYAFGELNNEVYEEFSIKVMDEILEIEKNIENYSVKISNLKMKIVEALKFTQTINKIWQEGGIEVKKEYKKQFFRRELH